PINSNTQAALKPSIERILANLACYSPAPAEAEEENGQLLTNIVKNLYKILNPNEEIYAKIRESSPENEDIISDLSAEIIQKHEIVQKKIDEYQESILNSSQDAILDDETIKKLTQERDALADEYDKLYKLKEKYKQ